MDLDLVIIISGKYCYPGFDYKVYPSAISISYSASGPLKKRDPVFTRLCINYMSKFYCPHGSDCEYAHGIDELTAEKQRVKMLVSCPHGVDCKYIQYYACNFKH